MRWKDEYSVGVAELDQQHRQILHIMDELEKGVSTVPDRAAVTDALRAMLKYAQEHFYAEEELMRRYAYPELQQQEAQHKYFLKKATEFSIGMLSDDRMVPSEIFEFLGTWWVTHILKWDMKYKAFFQDKIGQRPRPQA
jgi:hemerythrin